MEADRRNSVSPALLAAARAWVVRRDAGLTAVERLELQRWLRADEAHQEAFATADQHRTDVDWALHAGVLDEVVEGLRQRSQVRRRRRRLTTGVLGAVAVICLVLFVRRDSPVGKIESPPPSTLAQVEPRRVDLPDGSSAELRGDSEIRLEYSEHTRRIALVRGGAHFKVRSGAARPFVVAAGLIEVTAVGTEFVVDARPTETAILVAEGKVSVERVSTAAMSVAENASRPDRTAEAKLLLSAGHEVIVSADQPFAAQPLSPAQMAEQLGWRLPVLQFAGTPLAEIIAAMNPHNPVKITLVDPTLGELQLSGVLRADKVGALLALLESDFPIRAERAQDVILLHRIR